MSHKSIKRTANQAVATATGLPLTEGGAVAALVAPAMTNEALDTRITGNTAAVDALAGILRGLSAQLQAFVAAEPDTQAGAIRAYHEALVLPALLALTGLASPAALHSVQELYGLIQQDMASDATTAADLLARIGQVQALAQQALTAAQQAQATAAAAQTAASAAQASAATAQTAAAASAASSSAASTAAATASAAAAGSATAATQAQVAAATAGANASAAQASAAAAAGSAAAAQTAATNSATTAAAAAAAAATAQTAAASAQAALAAEQGKKRSKRVPMGATLISANPTVSVVWDTPFADANYTLQATLQSTNAGLLGMVPTITAQDRFGATVTLKILLALAAGAGTVHFFAIHD
jgi:hypothetical protein